MRIPRVPQPLALLLAAAAILGVTWAVLLPAFQAPDENAHFAYVQRLAERGELPGTDPALPYQSTAQNQAGNAVNSDQTATQLLTRPEWSPEAELRWRRAADALPRSASGDGGGVSPASAYPPLYYLYGSLAYRAASADDLFGRLVAIRIGSVLWLLVTVAATWLLAGEAFGRDRRLQLAAAAVPALAPMVVFISSSITPDTMMYALWTVALWLSARVVRLGARPVDAGALALVAGLAVVTKATSFALLPVAVAAIALGLWRVGPRGRPALAAVAVALVALVATVGTWSVAARELDRPVAAQLTDATSGESATPAGFARYVWRFYRPASGFGAPAGYRVWFKQSWGAFGWLEVRWPSWVYAALLAATLAVALAAAAALVRDRRRTSVALAAVLALAVVALLAGLHWAEYRSILSGAGPINQGRYLFPLVGIAGLVAAKALTLLAPARRSLALGAGIGVLLALHLSALAIVTARFYG